jgi:hypothetical protein
MKDGYNHVFDGVQEPLVEKTCLCRQAGTTAATLQK